jgi:hypothetical protein
LFIPRAIGTSLPDDKKHDGYFFAADVGSAINDNHIDVFTGTSRSAVFDFVQSTPSEQFDAFLAQDAEIVQALTDLHRHWIFGEE